MSWQVIFRPEIEDDLDTAAAWYDAREQGLGSRFIREVIAVWDRLAVDPVVGSHRHRKTDIRWRYPARFPYRVVYRLNEENHTVLVVAVLHAARHDRHWQSRRER
ncbi:type II toxin-antitoxin system RelE/ParE family toxin [Luteolibacter flavescens]|uniref:Type II toxin-antitoxin system RelE/ParE family toxin n=1 Tax=Luteolibacter flavescens TaxID=1859460 RepID=A0ABT3FJE6_9BACT|nr:type II toxin-antitoxin system RelE/ParE family toxin [Luteolibacter flavescens]MCW1883695.1 type II toxin-antitoxin system RelE/ParE family toxin [Luteolibacter flavescens]